MSTFKTGISRELAAEYGRRAVLITESGEYPAPSGRVVNVSRLVKRSIDGTVSYPPDQPFQESARGNYQTKISVENMTTLEAARRLINEGPTRRYSTSLQQPIPAAVFSPAPDRRRNTWPDRRAFTPVSETMRCMRFTGHAATLFTRITQSILLMSRSFAPITASFSMNPTQLESSRARQ